VSKLRTDLLVDNPDKPLVVTVKLLGLEGSKASILSGAKAMVEWIPEGSAGNGTKQQADTAESLESDSRAGRLWEMTTKFLSKGIGLAGQTAEMAAEKVKSVTGLGYGSRQEGTARSKSSGSAFLWQVDIAQSHQATAMKMEPTLARVIGHLHHREGWDVDRIGGVVGLDQEAVSTAAAMRGNFGVVWHEAFHFLCPPHKSPLGGSVRITVRTPFRLQQHADSYGGLMDSSGLVGSLVLNLHHTPVPPDCTVQRRVRAHVRRAGANPPREGDADQVPSFMPTSHDKLQGDFQCETEHGDPVDGVLVEFLVEIRELSHSPATTEIPPDTPPEATKRRYWRNNSLGLASVTRHTPATRPTRGATH